VNPGSSPETASLSHEDRGRSVNTACVFCSGVLSNPERAARIANASDLVIAADGGTAHLANLGLRPDAIVGDMDSLKSSAVWDGEDIARLTYPSDKDKSDAELAVEYALAQGCRRIILLAATGKRLDHTLGNVALAARYPGCVAIADGDFTLMAVSESGKCLLSGRIGATVSLIPCGDSGVRVTTRGLKYALDCEPLAFATHGLSNQLSQTEARVSVEGGVLLVCIENGEIKFDT